MKRRMAHPELCEIDGCARKYRCMGMCNMHYERQRTGGDVRGIEQERHPNGTVSAWLKDHIARTDHGEECIEFPFSYRNQKGYALANVDGKTRLVHRYVLQKVSDISGEMALHSTACNSRACVNPNHLRWGSAKDNYEDAMTTGTHKNART